jgi:GTP cyclohydrolase II
MRPSVTLTFAQTLDGSISLPGRRLTLSGPEAMTYTHELRAQHDAILVGVGTVIVDDPQLTVRLASGPNPQPIVLDTHLRLPLTAVLLSHPTHSLWIAVTQPDPARAAELEARGVTILSVPADSNGRVALPALLDILGERGIKTLMIEGGASVITEFLKQRLANRLIITIAPQLIDGLRATSGLDTNIRLKNISYRPLGRDLIIEAELE